MMRPSQQGLLRGTTGCLLYGRLLWVAMRAAAVDRLCCCRKWLLVLEPVCKLWRGSRACVDEKGG